jgi:hypothetical protein
LYYIHCYIVKYFLKLLYFLKENAKVAPAGHGTEILLHLPECRFGTAFYIRVKSLNRTRIIFSPPSWRLFVHALRSQNNECSVHLSLHHRKKAGAPAGSLVNQNFSVGRLAGEQNVRYSVRELCDRTDRSHEGC